jgi:hypothetical protein
MFSQKNLTPWQDSNPDLLFPGRKRWPLRHDVNLKNVFVADAFMSLPSNTKTMQIKLIYTQQHSYVSLKKTYILAGFEPGSSCSWGGSVDRCAMP